MILLIVLAVLFVPIPAGRYKDGGTRCWKALTYEIVVWNRLIPGEETFHKTSVYWFPDNFKDIDELWEMENPKQ